MNDGPFPEQNEPIKLPIGTNPLHPQVVSSPVARIFASDRNNMGNAETFPYVATTYSITELFRHWMMVLAFFLKALSGIALFSRRAGACCFTLPQRLFCCSPSWCISIWPSG